MPTRAFITVADYGGPNGQEELSTTLFWVQDISDINYASVTQDIDEVKDAIAPTIRGVIREVGFTKTFPESGAAVSDVEAQREDKWLVVYRDTTQFLDAANTIANAGYLKVFNFEIPTAELTGHLLTNSDVMNIASGEGLTLANTIEANVRSPYNHTANAPTIEVLRIVHVGRNT